MRGQKKKQPRKIEPVVKKEPASRSVTRELALIQELNREDDDSPAQLLGSDAIQIKIRGVISTQCPGLDNAIGRGGIPLGRITIVHGKESSGKTTLALHCAAEVQRQGGMCVYADSEYKLDPDYAKGIGVDLESLILVQPKCLERFFRVIERAIGVAVRYRAQGSNFPVLIILDSINSLGTKAEMDADWDAVTVAQVARFYSDKLKKLIPMISHEDIALLFISQERERINVLYGKKEQTGGGKALRYYSSLMLEVVRTGSIKENEIDIGNETKVRCAKNQIAPPFREAEFRIIYGKGVDYDDSLIREAVRLGKIEKSGAWYSFQGERIGQGTGSIAARMLKDESFRDLIREAVTRHDV